MIEAFLIFGVNMDTTVHMTDMKITIIHSIEVNGVVWNMG